MTAKPKRSFGQSTNLVGLPTDLLGSREFNDYPQDLHISGAREMNKSLFEMLLQAPDLGDAGIAFHAYMSAMFGADPDQMEGAVLKGWVQSRFGLFPTYHKDVIDRISGPVWTAYVEEKMSSRFHNNAIHTQLDMVYEFCQWALAKHVAPERRHITLYRGTNSFDEHQIVERLDRRRVIMRINNLASFSNDRDVAGCFGDIIVTAQVPVVKVVFFNSLLPVHPLKGEGEYLVIGGEYLVDASYL